MFKYFNTNKAVYIIFNLQNHYSFGMYAWNLPYCEVLTLDLCLTSVCKKVDLKLQLISASS